MVEFSSVGFAEHLLLPKGAALVRGSSEWLDRFDSSEYVEEIVGMRTVS